MYYSSLLSNPFNLYTVVTNTYFLKKMTAFRISIALKSEISKTLYTQVITGYKLLAQLL